ncbi:hypothetical protein KR200_008961 [Drosophila serrata]|nr:hypothetical protein KR200_008961 [Drosophila serrata]
MLKDILRKYEADCQGNPELSSQLDKIRTALKLGDEYVGIKTEALTNFKVYNAIRMLLNQRIKERIDKLNDLLPSLKPKSRCSRFYLTQRTNLKEIEKLSNEEKQARLTQNSVACPTASYDYNDESDYYIYIADD